MMGEGSHFKGTPLPPSSLALKVTPQHLCLLIISSPLTSGGQHKEHGSMRGAIFVYIFVYWAMSPSQGPWEELVWKYFKIQKNSNKIKNYSLFDRVYHNVNRSTLDLIWRIIKIDPFHPCSLFSLGYCMILSLMMNWRYVGQWLINTNVLVQNACTKWNIFVFMLVSCIGEKHWYCSILI